MSQVLNFGSIAGDERRYKKTVAHTNVGPENGAMKHQASAQARGTSSLRDRLIRVEARLEHMPTRCELHRAITGQTWRIVTWTTGVCTALTTATFAIAKWVH